MLDKLTAMLAEYFKIGSDCYTYQLERHKSAADIGTLTTDDFREFDESDVEEIAAHLIAAGVTVRQQGRWVLTDKTMGCNGTYTHKCGVCEDYFTTDAGSLFYCPRCGEKMVEIERPAKYGNKIDLVDGEWKCVYGLIREGYIEKMPQAPRKEDDK